MKKFALLLMLALAAGAAQPDYFPMKAGMSWVYEFRSSQKFEYTVEVARVDGQRALIRTIMPAVLTQEWYLKDKDGVELTGMEDPDGTRAEYTPARPYLRMPVQPGTTWAWKGRLGQSSEISDQNKILSTAQVKVPAGTFTCVVVETVTTQSGGELKQTSYYAPGVGLVKYVSRSQAGSWLSQLKSWSEGGSAPKP